jgi:hypothetical protein
VSFVPSARGFEGNLEIAPRRLLALVADAILIVDGPVIADDVFGIEEECFRRSHDPKGIGNVLVEVLQHGKRHVALLGVG